MRPSEPCIFAIFDPTIFKFRILIEDYIKINDTSGFFDSLSISSQIKIFKKFISSFFGDFSNPS
jgi:hypothetical protein